MLCSGYFCTVHNFFLHGFWIRFDVFISSVLKLYLLMFLLLKDAEEKVETPSQPLDLGFPDDEVASSQEGSE